MKTSVHKYAVILCCSLTLCLELFPAGLLHAQEAESPVEENEVQDSAVVVEDRDSELQSEPANTLDPDEREQALVKRLLVEAHIAELEASAGAYSPELSQAYTELGDTLRTLGLYEEAISALDRSFQNVRINKGLYDPQQLQILDALIESNLASEKWDETDNYMHLYYSLIQRNFESGSELRINTLLQLSRWKAYAVNARLISDTNPSAIVDVYKNEIRRLQEKEDYEKKVFDLARLNLGVAEYQLFLTSEVARTDLKEFRTGESPTRTSRVECYLVRLANGSYTQVCTPVEDTNMDYYLMPSHARNLEMQRHLDDMREALADAYSELEKKQDKSDEFNQLLGEVNRLTVEYNNYIENYLQ